MRKFEYFLHFEIQYFTSSFPEFTRNYNSQLITICYLLSIYLTKVNYASMENLRALNDLSVTYAKLIKFNSVTSWILRNIKYRN